MYRQATLAQLGSGASALVGPALIATMMLFFIVMFQPLLTVRTQFFIRNDLVLVRAAWDMFFVDRVLFALVFGSGIVAPTLKMVLSIWLWYRVPISRAARFAAVLSFVGRLALLDIILLALIIILFKGIGVGRIDIRVGLYFYMLVVFSSILLNVIFERLIANANRTETDRRANEQGEVTPVT